MKSELNRPSGGSEERRQLLAGIGEGRRSPGPPLRSLAVSAGFFCFLAVFVCSLLVSCGQKGAGSKGALPSPELATNGTIEVTARLVEIPEGAIFKRDLYDYATVLKYQVIQVHRGTVAGDTIYVGHYNPWKPRSEAKDSRAKIVGGSVKQFRAGEVHRMALEVPIEDYFMGGIVNKYFGQMTNAIHWAVWTDAGSE